MLKEHNDEIRKKNQEVLTTAPGTTRKVPGTSRSNFSLAGSKKKIFAFDVPRRTELSEQDIGNMSMTAHKLSRPVRRTRISDHG